MRLGGSGGEAEEAGGHGGRKSQEACAALSHTEFFCYHQGLLNKTEIESDTEFEVPALAAR